jgi:lipopolysaccharide transport system ATP-binding protein
MSSNTPVIEVSGISKCFRIYDRPHQRLKQILRPNAHHTHRDFWALKNINFEVGKGQTVGIIGQNGSGKSTLLQIITGTMSPTEGYVKTHGKTAALLELGSGFNPDFTGRENVYLNGSLLGLTREQVDEKFDFIAGFADIGAYIDQPVKTYSRGMMLRLAFAVQVAIETEVLIIDEALAVGDARFQLKCFKRLEELKSRGTTILFVSHATELVRSFCEYGLLLEKGKALYWGDAKTATIKYLASLFPTQESPDAAITSATESASTSSTHLDSAGVLHVHPEQNTSHTFGAGGATLNAMEIEGLQAPNIVPGGQPLKFRCHFSWDTALIQQLIASDGYKPNITLGITLTDKKGLYLFGCNGFDQQLSIDCLTQHESIVEFTLTAPYLAAEDYFVAVAIALGDLKHHIQLKWYDTVTTLRYTETDKKVFGMFHVDYKMHLIDMAKG